MKKFVVKPSLLIDKVVVITKKKKIKSVQISKIKLLKVYQKM
jgi:hypothetical protein